jgi:hypothetical protein
VENTTERQVIPGTLYRNQSTTLLQNNTLTLLLEFDRYEYVKGKTVLPNYWYFSRKKIEKLGNFSLEHVPILLRLEKLDNRMSKQGTNDASKNQKRTRILSEYLKFNMLNRQN